MKLVIGKPDYACKIAGELKAASILGRKKGRDLQLLIFDMPAMQKKRDALPYVRGFPTACSYDAKLQKLWLFPAPDGEYELSTAPPIQDVSAPEPLKKEAAREAI